MRSVLVLLVVLSLWGCRSDEDETLGKLFFSRGVQGGMLLISVDGSRAYRWNTARLDTRFSPGALFFMPAYLTALAEKAVPDAEHLESWDGTEHGLAEWNRDHSLDSAIRWSCDWFWLRMSNRVGEAAWARKLRDFAYGDGKVGPGAFWNGGALTISAEEQGRFLGALYREALPVRREFQQHLKAALRLREIPGGAIYGKTAWIPVAPTRHGWFAGFVESKARGPWVFVLNLTIVKPFQSAFRQEIVYDALRLKGILP